MKKSPKLGYLAACLFVVTIIPMASAETFDFLEDERLVNEEGARFQDHAQFSVSPNGPILYAFDEAPLVPVNPARPEDTEISTRILDVNSGQFGPTIRVNNGGGDSTHPTMVWLDGLFYLAWTDDTGVRMIRLDESGNIIGNRIEIHNCLHGALCKAPDIAINPITLDIELVWYRVLPLNQSAVYQGVVVRPRNMTIGPVMTYGRPFGGGGGPPAIAFSDNGSKIVAWSHSPIPEESVIHFQVFNPDGTSRTNEITATDNLKKYSRPNLDVFPGTVGFVLSWISPNGLNDTGNGSYVRAFNLSGAPISNEFQLDSNSTGGFCEAAVQGDYLFVAWNEAVSQSQPNETDVYMQIHNWRQRAIVTQPILVNQFIPGAQARPFLGFFPMANGIIEGTISWESNGQIDSEYHIFSRRFSLNTLP